MNYLEAHAAWISKKYNLDDLLLNHNEITLCGFKFYYFDGLKVEDIKVDDSYIELQEKLTRFFSDAMASKGYGVHLISDLESQPREYYESSVLSNVWKNIDIYSNSNPQGKSKLEPYTIDLSEFKHKYSGDINGLAVFIEVFGKYDPTNPGAELGTSLAVGVVTAALLDTAIIPGVFGSGVLSFKMSIYDADAGKMIWYQEGQSSDTRNDNDAFLRQNVKEFLKYEFPKPKEEYAKSKFKKRSRSLI